MLTINRLRREGLQHFVAIHDSYGVHAQDVERLRDTLRAKFIKMHQNPLLQHLWEQQLDMACSTPSLVALDQTIVEQIVDGERGDCSEIYRTFFNLRELRDSLPAKNQFQIERVATSNYMFS